MRAANVRQTTWSVLIRFLLRHCDDADDDASLGGHALGSVGLLRSVAAVLDGRAATACHIVRVGRLPGAQREQQGDYNLT